MPWSGFTYCLSAGAIALLKKERVIWAKLLPYLCGSAKLCTSKVKPTGSLEESENVRDIFELLGLGYFGYFFSISLTISKTDMTF